MEEPERNALIKLGGDDESIVIIRGAGERIGRCVPILSDGGIDVFLTATEAKQVAGALSSAAQALPP